MNKFPVSMIFSSNDKGSAQHKYLSLFSKVSHSVSPRGTRLRLEDPPSVTARTTVLVDHMPRSPWRKMIMSWSKT